MTTHHHMDDTDSWRNDMTPEQVCQQARGYLNYAETIERERKVAMDSAYDSYKTALLVWRRAARYLEEKTIAHDQARERLEQWRKEQNANH